MKWFNSSTLFLGAALLVGGHALAAMNDYAGLWVGQVALSHVNEVAVPLDEHNTPIAPNPNVPTPAHDEAYLRLILHVNGAGQVHLLRDVALLKQADGSASGAVAQSESDYVLVTDERLYADFPRQEAVRIASAVFDFGDRKATDAVDGLVDAVVDAVAESAQSSGVSSTSRDSALRHAEQNAQLAGENAGTPKIGPADVNAAFAAFLRDELPSGVLTSLATTEPLNLTALRTRARALQAASFYADARAVRMLDDLEAAVNAADGAPAKQAVAHNVVSRYRDFDNRYQRFITGRSVGDLIVDAAAAAAKSAVLADATAQSVGEAVDQIATVIAVRKEALQIKVAAYEDTAAPAAVDLVLDAVVESAMEHRSESVGAVERAAEVAGLSALESRVPRYALQVESPTQDYTAFVSSASFAGAVPTAAKAAALAAVKAAKNDPFHSVQTLKNAARIAAVNALQTVYAEAARARQTELPMTGRFAVGEGDSRLVSTISQQDAPLGAAALTAAIFLPANHPTNPFRHRRHPDHTTGFDIRRQIRIDFDAAPSNELQRVSFGVDQIHGTYREEIFGLHKPLGPAPQTNPIGLKVEGQFELNRISHIDTLNSF